MRRPIRPANFPALVETFAWNRTLCALPLLQMSEIPAMPSAGAVHALSTHARTVSSLLKTAGRGLTGVPKHFPIVNRTGAQSAALLRVLRPKDRPARKRKAMRNLLRFIAGRRACAGTLAHQIPD